MKVFLHSPAPRALMFLSLDIVEACCLLLPTLFSKFFFVFSFNHRIFQAESNKQNPTSSHKQSLVCIVLVSCFVFPYC